MINRTVSVLYIVFIALTSLLFYGCACLIWCLTKPFDRDELLAIVKELVTTHGGEIAVHSKVGQGSTFTIRLPVDGQTIAD